MSLKESWLADRHHRQQEAMQRQQAVQQILSEFNQTRQVTATHLQSQLAIFRAELSQQDEQRRVDFQSLQAELQLYCQQLQQETAELLGMAAADRELMAQQLATELQRFHQDLQASVRSLRAATQIDLTSLKADSQAFLADCRDHRLQVSAETQQTLIQFMETLRGEVQSYLTDLEHLRQQRADQVHQDLQHSRRVREAEVQQIFQHLASFRSDLRQFRQSLSHTVWGHGAPVEPPSPQILMVPKISAIPPATAIAPKLAATKPTLTRSAPAKTVPPAKAPTLKSSPKAAPKAAPAAKKVGVPKVSVTTSVAPAPQPVVSSEVPFEKDIYTFLHENHGARLTQIESGLSVNRFQAVDALRSLIKKGLVTQRDRVYLIQEPQ